MSNKVGRMRCGGFYGFADAPFRPVLAGCRWVLLSAIPLGFTTVVPCRLHRRYVPFRFRLAAVPFGLAVATNPSGLLPWPIPIGPARLGSPLAPSPQGWFVAVTGSRWERKGPVITTPSWVDSGHTTHAPSSGQIPFSFFVFVIILSELDSFFGLPKQWCVHLTSSTFVHFSAPLFR